MTRRAARVLVRTLAAAGLAAGLLLGATAQAAPWAVTATLEIQFSTFPTVTAVGSGTVDVSAGVVSVPASLVTLTSAVIPITSTTSIDSLEVSGLANQSGTFAVGGATTQVTGEICTAAASFEACVAGGGLGGVMGLDGTLVIAVIPGIVELPFDLDVARIGQGGSTFAPYTMDGAPWTTGTARVGLPTLAGPAGTLSTVGASGAESLTLVTTTFVAACGNVFPLISRFTLTSVPEPAVLGLVALGVAGLGLRRLRRS